MDHGAHTNTVTITLGQLSEIERLENTRQRRRFWLPLLSFSKLFSWSSWEPSDANVGNDDDEDPGKE